MVSNPKFDCETLMNAVLPFAQQMLQRDGEFFPFGGAMKHDGDIVYIAGYEGTEHPPSADIIQLLKAGFMRSADNNEYKATAVVYDSRVMLPNSDEKSDAIAVQLDHRDGYNVIEFFAYTIVRGEVIVRTTFTRQGQAEIFAGK